MAGFRDYLRMAMGWWSSVPLVVEELANVDCESVWHATGRETHGKLHGRTVIGSGMQRYTFARSTGRTAIVRGRQRNTVARIDT